MYLGCQVQTTLAKAGLHWLKATSWKSGSSLQIHRDQSLRPETGTPQQELHNRDSATGTPQQGTQSLLTLE